MHIGLIGGIGPKATSFYYQRIVQLFGAASKPLRLTIAHTDIGFLAKNMASNDKQSQVNEYKRVTDQLAGAGADRVVITSLGGSFCADDFAPVSPLPLMDGPQAMSQHLKSRLGVEALQTAPVAADPTSIPMIAAFIV